MIDKRFLIIFFLVVVFIFAFSIVSATFYFPGYTKYTNGTEMGYVNVSIEVYNFTENGPPTLIGIATNLTNTTGFFNLTINSTYDSNSFNYKPILARYNGTAGNGTYATYIGQSLPEFPNQEMQMLQSSTTIFYLKESITIDLSLLGNEHAYGNLSDVSNISFPTNFSTGLETVNLSGYGNEKFWAYVNASDCLFILNSTYSVNMSFCNLNITSIDDLDYTNLLGGSLFFLLNRTQIEQCNYNSGSINCTTSYNITNASINQTFGIEYMPNVNLFYISTTNSTGTHWIWKYNTTFSFNSSMDRPDYPQGKMDYYNGYVYTSGNQTGKGEIIYRCAVNLGNEVCEDYSIFKTGENVKGIEYNSFDSKWYYASTLNNSIVQVQDPFVQSFNFYYQVKDGDLGYPVKANWDTVSSSASFSLPIDKNFSLMVYPNNGPGFPAKIDLQSLNVNGSNVSLGDRNATITNSSGFYYLNLSNANMTTEFRQLTGYAKYNYSASQQNFTGFTILAYLLEGGNMVFQGSTLPQNMGEWQWPQITDVFNTTSGFYNITLPASVLGSNLLLFAATSVNDSGNLIYYGGFRNTTLTYGENPSPINFTVYRLLGNASNLSVGFEGQSDASVVQTSLMWIKFQNGSSGEGLDQAHVEIAVDYSEFVNSSVAFSWMADIGNDDAGILKIPLLNGSIDKIQSFTQQFAPLKKSISQSDLQNNITYVNLTAFSSKGMDGSEISDVQMMMYLHPDDGHCSVPSPPIDCWPIAGGMDKNEFNPFSMVIGGGKLDFEIKKTSNNITVRYVDVNLLASGPPDAVFDESANKSGSSTIEEAWRFGSLGPEIYSYILIGVPYNVSAINESLDINVNITKLYGDNWTSPTWEQGENTTGQLSGTDYSDFGSGNYNNYMNGTGVLCNSSDSNLSSGLCYKDLVNNLLWFKIPHFSGIGPDIVGTGITALSSDNPPSSSSSSGGGALSFWVNTYVQDDKEFSEKIMINNQLGEKERVRIKINKQSHYVGVTNIDGNLVIVEVSSTPQQRGLSVGDQWKVDVTGDNYYDLLIKLNSVSNNKADVTVSSINEKIDTNKGEAPISGGVTEEPKLSPEEKSSNFAWLWIVGVLVVGIIIFGWVLNRRKRSK